MAKITGLQAKLLAKQFKRTLTQLGYAFFESGDYNVNIIRVRNSDTGTKVTNRFDDTITVSYKENGEWQYHEYNCTTDPGDDWVDNPMLEKGVAILKPGQYRGSHKLRLHQGKYLSLIHI